MSKPDIDVDSTIQLLRNVQGFHALDDDTLAQMAQVAIYRDVARGCVIIQEGDPADNLYIVLKGRFVVLAGGAPIAEISMGEPIGELAFFAGGTRTASVVAARNSSIMCLSREAYDTLAARTPALANGILAALSQRLARTISSSPELRPKAGKICSIFPGINERLAPEFTDGLKQAFENVNNWLVLEAADCPAGLREDEAGLSAWLEDLEATQGNLVLLCTDPAKTPAWRAVTANNSDTILIAAPKDEGTQNTNVTPLETELMAATLKSNIQLALYRKTSDLPTMPLPNPANPPK